MRIFLIFFGLIFSGLALCNVYAAAPLDVTGVRPGPVTVDGRSVLLEEYAISAREQLILKPVMLHGGAGVTPGWQTEPDEWAAHQEEQRRAWQEAARRYWQTARRSVKSERPHDRTR